MKCSVSLLTPPYADIINGVKEPCSISITRWLYLVFFWFSFTSNADWRLLFRWVLANGLNTLTSKNAIAPSCQKPLAAISTPLAPQNAGAPQNAYFQFSWISCPWKQEWWQFSVPISGLVFCLTNWANIFNWIKNWCSHPEARAKIQLPTTGPNCHISEKISKIRKDNPIKGGYT